MINDRHLKIEFHERIKSGSEPSDHTHGCLAFVALLG